MPHLQLELPTGLLTREQISQALEALTRVFSAQETIDPAAIKAYARPSEVWLTGEGGKPAFIHLTVCVLAGRPDDLLGQISDRLFHTMKEVFRPMVEDDKVGLTLEIREMGRDHYRKGGLL
ncbi:MAG: hypothetical protein LCH41_00905 [Armatimonadetes bacterium]|nr:hypothetical protein [Armatimonadota bacterium]